MIIEIQDYWGDREVFNQPEICSRIIQSMTVDGEVTLMTKEGRSAYANGGFALLDSLCEFWKWDKSKITLITTNQFETHPEYNVINSFFHHTPITDQAILKKNYIPWNKEKIYGMFIGRATAPRIHAIHAHHEFKYKHMGLTSFNDDLFNFMDKTELIDYYMDSGKTYKDMISIKPYSDISSVCTPPITAIEYNKINWDNVYEKIGIEIVCETTTAPGNYNVTEKLDRPMLHGIPFFTIAPAGFNKHLHNPKSRGGKSIPPLETFDRSLPIGYDDLEGKSRVDAIFKNLEILIDSGEIYSFIEECKKGAEYNRNLLDYILNEVGYESMIQEEDKVLWDYWKNYGKKYRK